MVSNCGYAFHRTQVLSHKIILNPSANRWKAQRQLERIHAAYQQSAISYDVALTTRAKEATDLAQQAVAQGYTAIVAAGGDGTVNEVVNGLVAATPEGTPTIPLGILPIGTGNDFADMLPLSRDIDAAVATLCRGQARQVDLGQVIVDGVAPHFFDNNCALAMEPMVGSEGDRFTRLSGTPRYLAGLVSALSKLNAWHMRVEWDGGQFEGRSVLLSVCNGPRAGSTFMMAPDAKVDDGLFDVVLAPDFSLGQILRVLPGLFNGSHLKHPEVRHFRTSWLKVVCEDGTPIHADGEMLGGAVREICYTVLPGKLTLLSD